MTDEDQNGTVQAIDDEQSDTLRRRVRIETTHADETTARQVARAISPDNTSEMSTSVVDDRVVSTITRRTTGGLRTSVDDYVVNLDVAVQLLAQDREPSTTSPTSRRGGRDDAEPSRPNGTHPEMNDT